MRKVYKYSFSTAALFAAIFVADPSWAAQQLIGLGTNANDGTGDSIRTSFTKVNANFADLYSQLLTTSNMTTLARNGANTDITSLNAYQVTPQITLNDGSFVVGAKYKILSLGTTNWNAVGFVGTPAVGLWFVASATGSGSPPGTGTATTATLTVSGQILISNIFNDPNAPQGVRSNYTQRANFIGAASFHAYSCIYGGTGYQAAYGTGTTCANYSMAPTAIVPDGQNLFVIGQTYKITLLGTTNWGSLGYVGTPVLGGTFVASATNSTTIAGTGQASAPFWTYNGKEFNVLTGAVVISAGNPGSTDSDLVGTSGALTINDTTEGTVGSGHLIIGNHYLITAVGSNAADWVAAGAPTGALGVIFVATGTGSTTNTGGQAKATGSHGYAGFFTINTSGLGKFPIGNGVKVEEALSCISGSCASVRYMVGASVQMNGTWDISGDTITAGAFNVGTVYQIVQTSTGGGAVTDFTLIGSPNNTPGQHFIASGAGTGTGTATEDATSAGFVVSGTLITQNYHYAMLLSQEIPHLGGALPQPLALDASIIGYDNPTPCTTTGGVISGGALVGGSGYTPSSGTATYNLVPMTGGTGSGMLANIVVTNGAVSLVQVLTPIPNHGTGYTIGDSLSAAASSIGGTVGTPFSWAVQSVAGVCPMTIANWVNLPNVTVTGFLLNSPHVQLTGDGAMNMSSLALNGYNQGTTGTILAAGTQQANEGIDFHTTSISDKYIWFPNFIAQPSGTTIPTLVLNGHSMTAPLANNMRVSGIVVANTGGTLCGAGAQWCWEVEVGVGLVDGTNPTVATVAYAPLTHP